MRAMQMKVLTIYLNCDTIITEGELKGSLVKVFTLLVHSIVEMMMNVAKRSIVTGELLRSSLSIYKYTTDSRTCQYVQVRFVLCIQFYFSFLFYLTMLFKNLAKCS